jgi:hypothetical protein
LNLSHGGVIPAVRYFEASARHLWYLLIKLATMNAVAPKSASQSVFRSYIRRWRANPLAILLFFLSFLLLTPVTRV